METFPIDVEPEQIVRWLMNEERLHAFDLLVRASRLYRHNALEPNEDGRFGETEREDLAESAIVGVVEVMPRRHPSLWTLRVRVADDIGPGVPEDEPVPEGEEQIDVETFYNEFMKADRGLAEASAEVESAGAKASLTRVVKAMREDRHEQ